MTGKGILGIIVLSFGFLFGLTIVFGSWYTVDEGERGVLLRNGAVSGTADPGLGFKVPIVDSIVRVSVQSKSKVYENVATYSKDQQTADLTLSVNYRLPADQIETIYSSYGGEEGVVNRLIDRRVYEQVKNVFGRFNAVTAIQERGRLNSEIETALRNSITGPVIIDSVQIENIDFSAAYEASIEQRMLAEVEVQKIRQNAEREKVNAEITVTQAKAQADATRAKAQAEADAIRVRGDAEADAIKARGDALKENPNLIDLTKAERWNGILPTTMLPNQTIPFIDMNK